MRLRGAKNSRYNFTQAWDFRVVVHYADATDAATRALLLRSMHDGGVTA